MKNIIYLCSMLFIFLSSRVSAQSSDLVITTNINDASIFITSAMLEGESLTGTAPSVFKNLTAGEYVIRIKDTFNKELSQTITIADTIQNMVHIDFPLGSLVINSNQDSVAIFINEINMGSTVPFIRDKLVEGEYDLKIIHQFGQHIRRDAFFVYADRVNELDLNFELGSLKIESNMESAQVLINQRRTEHRVPCIIPEIPQGPYTIVLKKGLSSAEEKIYVQSGIENLVDMTHKSWLSSNKWYFITTGVVAVTAGTILLTGDETKETAAIGSPPPFPEALQ